MKIITASRVAEAIKQQTEVELNIASEEAARVTNKFLNMAKDGYKEYRYWHNSNADNELLYSILIHNGYKIEIVKPTGQWIITVD